MEASRCSKIVAVEIIRSEKDSLINEVYLQKWFPTFGVHFKENLFLFNA